MPAQLSYAPVVRFHDGNSSLVEFADNFGRDLRSREIPACYIGRGTGISLGMAIKMSQVLTKREILTVIELQTGDNVLDYRILFETCVLGTVELAWKSGQPDFDLKGLKGLLDSAGRHRLPVDLVVNFGNIFPDREEFGPVVSEIGELADKYGHVQVVKLTGIPENEMPAAIELLKSLVEVCPRSKPAVSPDLWIKYGEIRTYAADLGLIEIQLEGSSIEKFIAKDISESAEIAESIGLVATPRLPLVPRFYSKGWYSFEVGKVLDHWVDRKVFRAYRDRPGWLKD